MTFWRKFRSAALTLALSAPSIGVLAAPSGDAASRLAPAFGNTIVSTHPDGRKARLWLSEEGTYVAQGRAGNRSRGTWKVKGDKLCLTQHRPLFVPIPYCAGIPAERVGRPWKDKAVNGDPVTNEIIRSARGAAG